uniref:Serine-threonine/tyrosine-protein kinase catalytic domain-containing protein n=1 Tax=Salix viminalis TaxID=40686 RepID=A0A6N2LY01_SALVM
MLVPELLTLFKSLPTMGKKENEMKFNFTFQCCFSGYIAPEYEIDGLFSIKSDVLSFGVLVLEIRIRTKTVGFLVQLVDIANVHCLPWNTYPGGFSRG